MNARETLVTNARIDIADADRAVAMHNTPATFTLHRRLREVTNALAGIDDTHLTVDEIDWLLEAARRVKPETEHPTAVATLWRLRNALCSCVEDVRCGYCMTGGQ